jgi:hypothetical protein
MGDRADPSSWPRVEGPLQVVLFEGWMLGFAPVGDSEAAAVDPALLPVNTFLRGYEAAWDSFVDAWLVVRVAQPDYAYRWRLQVQLAALHRVLLCCGPGGRLAQPPLCVAHQTQPFALPLVRQLATPHGVASSPALPTLCGPASSCRRSKRCEPQAGPP